MSRSDGISYDGIPYAQLQFDVITWPLEVIEHMAKRSTRYERPEFDITNIGWADDAVADPFHQVGDGRSNDGETVRVIGWSPSAPPRGSYRIRGRLLKVWLAGDGHASGGRWIGRTACDSNDTDRRRYMKAENDREEEQ